MMAARINVGSRTIVNVADIVWLCAELNYTHVFLANGSRIFSSTTLSVIERRLLPYNSFFRINRQNLVNISLVETIDNDAIMLQGDHQLYFSKRKKKLWNETKIVKN